MKGCLLIPGIAATLIVFGVDALLPGLFTIFFKRHKAENHLPV